MLRIHLRYDSSEHTWCLDTIVKGVGVSVRYLTKPTKRQIRRQLKALHGDLTQQWGKRYNIKTGKFS